MKMASVMKELSLVFVFCIAKVLQFLSSWLIWKMIGSSLSTFVWIVITNEFINSTRLLTKY